MRLLAASLALQVVVAGAAFAHAPSASGAARVGPAPASVAVDQTQHDERIHVFVEREGVTLDQPLTLDRSATSADPVELPAGTTVNSIFVHFDPVTPGTMLEGTVTVDEDLLGVLMMPSSVAQADALFRRPGTEYPMGTSDGRGIDQGLDEIVVDPAGTVRMKLHVPASSTGTKQLRIITRAEDEEGGCHCASGGATVAPGALALLMIASLRVRSGRGLR